MRNFEVVGRVTTDRVLIDLREAHDDLAIRIRILQAGDAIDAEELGTLKRNLAILDHRISNHMRLIEA